MTDAAALAPRRTPLMRRLPPSLRKLLRNRAFVSGFVLLMDKDGIVQHALINNLPLGRNVTPSRGLS